MNIAFVDFSITVKCPRCRLNNDLADDRHDPDTTIASHIFSNRWDRLEGWEITCQHCGREFKLDKVEY